MFKKILTKISYNTSLYKKELHEEGLSYLVTARIIKFPFTRSVYNAFKPESVQVGKHRMYIDRRDMIVSQVLFTKHIWDPYASSIFAMSLQKGDIFLDIGAHIGYYSLLGASIVGVSGKVYAFEPDAVSYSLLKRNIAENQYDRITPINKAVSDTTGVSTLYLNRENTGDNKLFPDHSSQETATIQTVKLDDFLKPRKVDVIKMDIQGAEMRALKGMSKLLSMNPGCRLLIEFWPEGLHQAKTNPRELLTFLQKYMYSFYLIDEIQNTTEKISVKNLLARVAKGEIYDTNLLCFREDLNHVLSRRLS